jgi:hypothetical protein
MVWGTSFIKIAKGADLRDLFRDRLRLWSMQSGCNHDFSALVVRLRWGAVHDDRCSLPGSLPSQEIKLLGAPLAPEVFRRPGAAVPSDAAAFGFLKVGLNPQRAVDPGHELSPAGSDPFHDDQVDARRNLDRPRPAAFVPAGRPVAHGFAVSQWLQDALEQEVALVKEGVMPGDIVGVNHRRGGHEPMKRACNGGFPASALILTTETFVVAGKSRKVFLTTYGREFMLGKSWNLNQAWFGEGPELSVLRMIGLCLIGPLTKKQSESCSNHLPFRA